MVKNLEGKVAVVTGASRGLGRSLCLELARSGCDIALVSRDAERMQKVRIEILAMGRQASVHIADVTDEKQMKSLPEKIIQEHGNIHLLINNAGASYGGRFDRGTLEDFHSVMNLNFWGVAHCCHFFLPYLKREKETHIVFISSIFALYGNPTNSYYSCSKFAARGLAEAISHELRSKGIHVSTTYVGPVNTDIVQNSGSPIKLSQEQRNEMIELFEKKAIHPDIAAKTIVDGVRKNKSRIMVTFNSYWMDLVIRFFPVSGPRYIYRNHVKYWSRSKSP